MLKRFSLFVSLIMVLTMTGTALAQGPGPQHTSPTWQATYWNNMTLSGTPALARAESDLDYHWVDGALIVVTYESRLTRLIAFDAVKWAPR